MRVALFVGLAIATAGCLSGDAPEGQPPPESDDQFSPRQGVPDNEPLGLPETFEGSGADFSNCWGIQLAYSWTAQENPAQPPDDWDTHPTTTVLDAFECQRVRFDDLERSVKFLVEFHRLSPQPDQCSPGDRQTFLLTHMAVSDPVVAANLSASMGIDVFVGQITIQATDGSAELHYDGEAASLTLTGTTHEQYTQGSLGTVRLVTDQDEGLFVMNHTSNGRIAGFPPTIYQAEATGNLVLAQATEPIQGILTRVDEGIVEWQWRQNPDTSC